MYNCNLSIQLSFLIASPSDVQIKTGYANYLHWEVWVHLVIVEYISDNLADHREERAESSQSSKVHYMFHVLLSIL